MIATNIAVKINGREYPNSPLKLETIQVGPGHFFTSLRYSEGGIILVRKSDPPKRTETFIPYHRVWEIETIGEQDYL